MTTKVKFLFHPKDKETFAYFPFIDEDQRGNKLSYQKIGQHGGCSPEYADECRQAKKEEYTDLLNEMVNLVGYDDLEVLNEVENIKDLPLTLEELYKGAKQVNIKLSDKPYVFSLALLDNRGKIDCKISSLGANLYARTKKGLQYEKYNNLSTLQREVKKLIKNKVDTDGKISFLLSSEVFTI